MNGPTVSEPQVIDPHGLLQSGEPVRTLPELAKLLDVSGKTIRRLLGGPLHETVRFVRFKPGGCRYCVADVLRAVEPLKPQIAQWRQRADDLERQQRAAKAATIAARGAPKPSSQSLAPKPAARNASIVALAREVLVRRTPSR
ncbi:MAG: hypothetical protein ACLP1X_24655 [Polyangiaceae bacterium]